MLTKENKFRWLFYSGWLILLVVQASFTELIDDEAYYWFYSRKLSWGYFDHPPMIALMIKAGYAILKNELGVRLFSVITSFTSIFIIESLLAKKNFKLFAAIVSSILIAQLGGFLAVPDSPYLFFTTLFVFQFKRYLEKDGFLNAIILGVLAACILYSKYHGSMLIFFMVLGCLRLFKRPSFYLTIIVGVACYLPHIVWLVQNDYPSFYYHFGERNVPSYKILFTLEYFLGQLAIYGPFTAPFIFYALFKYRGTNSFEKVLTFSAFSVFVFLFIFSFIGTVEANWSIAIFTPLLIITHQFLEGNKKVRKIFYYTVPVSIIILLILRVHLIYDLTGGKIKINIDFHHKKEWALKVKEKAGDLPVVFVNSYQKASLYAFYTGSTSMSLNNILGRMNQYNISDVEESLQGKKVFVVANWPAIETDTFYINNKVVMYSIVESFNSYSKVYFYNDDPVMHIKQNERIHMSIRVGKRYCDEVKFIANPSLTSYITYHYFVKRKLVHGGNTGIEFKPELMETQIDLDLSTPPEKGTYYLRVSLTTGWLPPTFNSKKWKVIVE